MAADAEHTGRRLRRRTRNFWATDHSLTLLLALLVANILIMPLAEFATWGRFGARATLSVMLISGLVATVRDRRIVAATIVFVSAGFMLGWENIARPNLYLHLIDNLVSLLSVLLLVALILHQVFRAGPITMRRIEGAIALYMLLGVLWAVAYELIELLVPGSFRMVQPGRAALPDLSYFSFTTLTTLGLGDVLPLSAPARSLVMLEGLVGQLFPAILIGRLVTLEVGYRHRSED